MGPAGAAAETCPCGRGGGGRRGAQRLGRGCLPRRRRAGLARPLSREPENARTRIDRARAKPMTKKIKKKAGAKRATSNLHTLLRGLLASGGVRLVDLTQTLSPAFPPIVLPPEMGQCRPFRMEEISRYDERGPGWYWNNVSFGEHTGTHFDAPIHWISGRDVPNNSVDRIPVEHFIAPACVIDCSGEAAADADFLLTVAHLKAWEK